MTLIEEIKDKLQILAPTQIELQDESSLHVGHKGNNGGGHFKLTITSPLFNDKPQLAQHRMIYQALNTLIPTKIHALSIRSQGVN